MIIPVIRPTTRYTSGGRLCPDVLGPLELWLCPDVLRALAIEVTRLYPEADELGIMLGSGLLALIADCTGQSVAAEEDDDRAVVQEDVPES